MIMRRSSRKRQVSCLLREFTGVTSVDSTSIEQIEIQDDATDHQITADGSLHQHSAANYSENGDAAKVEDDMPGTVGDQLTDDDNDDEEVSEFGPEEEEEENDEVVETLSSQLPHTSHVMKDEAWPLNHCTKTTCLHTQQHVHCPLCPDTRFAPTPMDAARKHFRKAHFNQAIVVGDLRIVPCHQSCHQMSPHFHCPVCGGVQSRKPYMTHHLMRCSGLRRDSARKPPLLANHNAQNLWRSLRTHADDGLTGVRPPLHFGHHTHASFVHELEDLAVTRCETCCSKFHCVLCPPSVFRPAFPQKVKDHLQLSHWKHRITYRGVNILKCCLPCLAKKDHVTDSHWHCPLCSLKCVSKSRMNEHLRCHDQGTARIDDDTDDGQTMDAVVEESPDMAEKKCTKVFASVAAVLSDQLLAAIPGSRSVCLDTLQRHTGVLCRTSADKCVVFADTWHSLKLVNSLLESIADGQPTSKTELQSIIDRQQAVDSHTTPDHVELWRELLARDEIATKLVSEGNDDDDVSQIDEDETCIDMACPTEDTDIDDDDDGDVSMTEAECDEEQYPSDSVALTDVDTPHNDDDIVEAPMNEDSAQSQENTESCVSQLDMVTTDDGDDTMTAVVEDELSDMDAESKTVTREDVIKTEPVTEEQENDEEADLESILNADDKLMPVTEIDPAEQCPSCSHTFRNRSLLLKHMVIAQKCSEKVESCPLSVELCDQLAMMKEVTTPECPQCHKKFRHLINACAHYAVGCCEKRLRQKHLYACVHCNSFTSESAQRVSDHEARVHNARTHTCTVCQRSYGSERLLKEHERFHTTALSMCHMCGQQMKSKLLKRHLVTCRDGKCTKPRSQSSNSAPVCDLCGFRTRSSRGLARHYARKHGDRQFVCSQCDATFALSTDLQQHVRNLHRADSSHVHRERVACDHCGKNMLKKNLDMHVRLVHNKVKEYSCSVCSRLFQTKYTLSCHMETHKARSDRTYRFLCSVCGAGFNNRTVHRDHVNMHTGERPYVCGVCGKRFKQVSTFSRHSALHRKNTGNDSTANGHLSCFICNAGFTNERSLGAHYSQQHGDGAYCFCGHEALSTIDLQQHQTECMVFLSQMLKQDSSVDQPTMITPDGETYVLFQPDDQKENQETILLLQQGEGDEIPVDKVKVEEVEEEQSFLCGYCQTLFVGMDTVQQHMLTAHLNELPQDNVDGDGDELVEQCLQQIASSTDQQSALYMDSGAVGSASQQLLSDIAGKFGTSDEAVINA